MTRASAVYTTARFSIADLNTEIDNEPRVHNLKLADSLGYNRARIVRELITGNEAESATNGSLAARHGKSRGQSFTEYFQNEGQSQENGDYNGIADYAGLVEQEWSVAA